MNFHTTMHANLDTILAAIEKTKSQVIEIEYRSTKTVLTRQELIKNYYEQIVSMPVHNIVDELEDVLVNLLTDATEQVVRKELYVINKNSEGKLEHNASGYLLFKNTQGLIKSVLPSNIISVVIDNYKLVR